MILKKATVNEIKDSRGEATIEVQIETEKGKFSAQIPSGKSRGAKEAAVLKYQDAVSAAEKIETAAVGKKFNSIAELDEFLIALDGTKRKEKLGGNVILGVSIAFGRALAAARNEELWLTLRKEFFPEAADRPPQVFSNLINGGLHASNNLDIQEYLVITNARNIGKLKQFYGELGDFFKSRYKLAEVSLGDEGGYSLNFGDNFEPIGILAEQIQAQGLSVDFSLGLDAAASGFYKSGYYVFEGRNLTTEELREVYLSYFKKMPLLFSIEDPFEENDGESFGKLQKDLEDKLVIGDDLTVTNPNLIQKAINEKMISGVIIKPNQIGTVAEACAAINVAQQNGLKCIISHRSGETEDNFIIHLAKACGAFGLKIGAPVASRLTKFDELARIYNHE